MKTYPTIQKLCKEIKVNDDIGARDLTAIEADLKKLLEVLPVLDCDKYRVGLLKFVCLPSRYAYYRNSNTSIVITTKNKQEGLTAFIHEFGHLIDYKNGEDGRKPYSKVSKDDRWHEVVKVFRKQHERHSEKDTELVFNDKKDQWVEREIWSSYDKYVRSSVEIFARGFEIYVTQKVGIKFIGKSKSKMRNNLLWYPSGKKSIETIINFYEEFFARCDK